MTKYIKIDLNGPRDSGGFVSVLGIEEVEEGQPIESVEASLYNTVGSEGNWGPFYGTVTTAFKFHPEQGVFRTPDNYTLRERIPIIVPVIPDITPTQLRYWLFINKKVSGDQITSIINSSDLNEQDKGLALISWEFALKFERKHTFINAIGPLLGMSDKEIDTAFIEASKL